MSDYRAKRIYTEVVGFLLPKFGDVRFDDEGYSWIYVENFPLPTGWNADYTSLLIWLPPNYPQFPPSHFSIRQGLQDTYGRSAGRHLGATPETLNKGWDRFCFTFHSHRWQPTSDIVSGDNLLTVSRVIFEVLKPKNMGR